MTAQQPTPMPGFTVRPDPVQVFSFSAATWNQHRIHYDETYTREHEGYDGLLVQGPLLGSWLLHIAERWAEPWGEVTHLAFRTHRAVVIGHDLTVTGEVVSGPPRALARVWVALADGTRVVSGEAHARPRGSSPALDPDRSPTPDADPAPDGPDPEVRS